MKKYFPLKAAGKADARVVEAIKHDIRKYVKRERKKTLPPGFETWEFACKVGAVAEGATETTLREVGTAIDAVAGQGDASVYVEVIAVPAHISITPKTPQPVADPASREAS